MNNLQTEEIVFIRLQMNSNRTHMLTIFFKEIVKGDILLILSLFGDRLVFMLSHFSLYLIFFLDYS